MIEWIAAHWEVLTGVVVFVGLCILAVFYLRAQNTHTVHETQTETIDAQKRLLESRTAERDEFERHYKDECEKHEHTKGELAALRSEFKILGAVILDELLGYWSRRSDIMAELAATKANNEILKMTIARLQTEQAGEHS